MTLPDWSGRTVACLASGPSLTIEDCERVREAGFATIVTNTTFRLCPWADVLMGHDSGWWTWHLKEVRESFRGQLFGDSHSHLKDVASAKALPGYVCFQNAGACAVSLAISAGAKDIVLLGYDCEFGPAGESHHHGNHTGGLPNCGTMPRWQGLFAKLARHAEQKGVRIRNASRRSALTSFECVTLDKVLHELPVSV